MAPHELTNAERNYVLERLSEQLALGVANEIELLRPEQVECLCKCDVRTLEKIGLQRRYLGSSIRYLRSDVAALVEASTIHRSGRAKKNPPQGKGGRVKSGLKSVRGVAGAK